MRNFLPLSYSGLAFTLFVNYVCYDSFVPYQNIFSSIVQYLFINFSSSFDEGNKRRIPQKLVKEKNIRLNSANDKMIHSSFSQEQKLMLYLIDFKFIFENRDSNLKINIENGVNKHNFFDS